ncbi:MAG: PhnB protein [Acidimicrobiaceae bacterium]
MSFHPYLMFGGTCREAFTRYHEIFGGELFIMPMSDVPSEESVPGAQPDLIVHAALTIDGDLLMASDDPTGAGPMQGIMVNCAVADVSEAERVFNALADGGEVTQPLTETFFSPSFGMCVDRFGTPWMISTAAADQPS